MNGAVLVFLTFFAFAIQNINGLIDCNGLPDGSYGAGCRSYTNCTDGVATIIDCDWNQAFNFSTGKCEPSDEVLPPCGSLNNDCKEKGSGVFPLLTYDCYWYYTCLNGMYLGANPCNNPPEGTALVYDDVLKVCNWKSQVAPPCGTKVKKLAPLAREE